jgi:hypothetical protein
MALILDLVDPQELVGYVRGFQEEQERNTFRLAAYLPNDNIDEIEYRITQGQLQMPDAAKVRAWDTESPIGSRQGLRRLFGELPPMSKKIRLGEEERLRKRKIETGSNAQIISAIYDDAANMSLSVLSRIEMMRGEVLSTAKININENGVALAVDFGRDVTLSVQAPFTWTDSTNADPVADYLGWVTTYLNKNGFKPAQGLTDTVTINALLTNTKMRGYVGRGAYVPGIITIADVQAVFAAYDLPPLVAYDTMVRVDGVQTRVLPAGTITFVPPAGSGLGGTLFGTTAESLTLVEARAIAQADAPGLVATVHSLDDPVATWTKVAGIALPTLVNPNFTMKAIVRFP